MYSKQTVVNWNYIWNHSKWTKHSPNTSSELQPSTTLVSLRGTNEFIIDFASSTVLEVNPLTHRCRYQINPASCSQAKAQGAGSISLTSPSSIASMATCSAPSTPVAALAGCPTLYWPVQLAHNLYHFTTDLSDKVLSIGLRARGNLLIPVSSTSGKFQPMILAL